MSLRFAIRMTIIRELLMETSKESTEAAKQERCHGIAEYIEILVSVIDGFNSPIKTEHLQIYEQCLLPMHRHHNLKQFRQQLIKAMSKFIIKDESLTDQAILACIKFWP